MPTLTNTEYSQGYTIQGANVLDANGNIVRSDSSGGAAPTSSGIANTDPTSDTSSDAGNDASLGSIYNYQQAARDALNEAAATRKGAQVSALAPYTAGLPNSDLTNVIGMINQGAGDTANTAYSSFIAAQNKALDIEQQNKNNAISLMQTIGNEDGFGELPDAAITAFSKASGIDANTLLGWRTAMSSKDPLVRAQALANLNQVNENTGLDVQTMSQALAQGGGTTGPSPSASNPPVNTPITGADGNTYDLSSFNPSNPNYVSTIQNTASSYGSVTTADQAQIIINNNSLGAQGAPAIGPLTLGEGSRAPVTGQMVMQAAQQYGVDPALMLSIMQNEQHFLTDPKGQLAIQNNNPGSIMGGPNGTLTKYATVQDGVNGLAQWLKSHQGAGSSAVPITPGNVQAGQNTYGVDLSRVAVDPNNPAQKIAAAKIQQTHDGNKFMYIDEGNLPSNIAPSAIQNWAQQNGVAILTQPEAAAVDISIQAQDLLNSPAIAAGLAVLPHQTGSSLTDPSQIPQNIATALQRIENQAEAGANQTDKGNILNNFNNATGSAIKELQGLTQGATGARFSTTLLNDVNSLNPNSISTYESAMAQLALIKNIYGELNNLYFAGAKPDLSQYVSK